MNSGTLPPDTAALLEAVENFLQTDLLPEMRGHSKFRTHVAISLLKIVTREIKNGNVDLEIEPKIMTQKLRNGKISWSDPEVFQTVKTMNVHALEIDNLQWIRKLP